MSHLAHAAYERTGAVATLLCGGKEETKVRIYL